MRTWVIASAAIVTLSSLFLNGVLWNRLRSESPIRHVRPSRPCAHAGRETSDRPAKGSGRAVETRNEIASLEKATSTSKTTSFATHSPGDLDRSLSEDTLGGGTASTVSGWNDSGFVCLSGLSLPSSEPPLAVLEREVRLAPAQREWIEQAILSQLDYEQRQKYEKLKRGETAVRTLTKITLSVLNGNTLAPDGALPFTGER